MEPLAAHSQAVLAAVDRRRQLVDSDLVQMATEDVVHRDP
jgi:hypothetical protein